MEYFYKVVRFGITGIIGMIIDFGVTYLLRDKLKWNKYLANTCGFTLAVINNYILNRFWTFQSTQDWLPEFEKFALFSVIGLVLNNSFIYLFHEKFKIHFYVSKAIAVFLVFFWNFFSNSILNFNK